MDCVGLETPAMAYVGHYYLVRYEGHLGGRLSFSLTNQSVKMECFELLPVQGSFRRWPE